MVSARRVTGSSCHRREGEANAAAGTRAIAALTRRLSGGTIIWDDDHLRPGARALTLKHRGLDFARAGEVFVGLTATVIDDRFDYGETRFITAGHLDERLVVMVWTRRGKARHVISMRHCHAEEEALWLRRMARF